MSKRQPSPETDFAVMTDDFADENQPPLWDHDDIDGVWEEETYEEEIALDADFQEAEIHSEGVEETVQVELSYQQEPDFFRVLLGRIWPTLEERQERAMVKLAEFDDAIEAYPKAAANYVFRGEIYLKIGQMELAVDDFELALDLATAEFEKRNWGIVAQTIRDRAQQGLKRAQERLV